jgi:hypothetical protein
MKRYQFIKEIAVNDPNGKEVVLEVWYDSKVNTIFALDWTFLEQVGKFSNPYTSEPTKLRVP